MSEKIFEKLSTAILEGDSDASASLTQQGLDEGVTPEELLNKGLIVGMDEVGVRFKAGDMFVPEVLMSAESMASGMTCSVHFWSKAAPKWQERLSWAQ